MPRRKRKQTPRDNAARWKQQLETETKASQDEMRYALAQQLIQFVRLSDTTGRCKITGLPLQ